jgi:hypothetical protein
MPTQDLRTYKRIGEKGEALTGYPAVSVYHDFKYDPKDFIKGTFDDWMYEHLGLYAWTTEIWSPQRQAGVEVKKVIEWFNEHPVEDDLKIYRWFVEETGHDGRPDGYVDWYPYDHPELGQVELGGWNSMYTWRNPPPHLLEKEIAPLADFAIFNCLISPKLEIHSLTAEARGDSHYYIRLVLHNTGWLPTQISQQALKMKVVREVEVDLALPDGAKLVSGKRKTMCGQLSGRDDKNALSIWASNPTNERTKVEWVIHAPNGGEAAITAVHQRAGTVRAVVNLDDLSEVIRNS